MTIMASNLCFNEIEWRRLDEVPWVSSSFLTISFGWCEYSNDFLVVNLLGCVSAAVSSVTLWKTFLKLDGRALLVERRYDGTVVL